MDNIRKMDAAKWGAFDYAELSGIRKPDIFALSPTAWITGSTATSTYDGTTLIRDELPYDPADPLTAPFEAAMGLADPRVSTYVVVVDRDESRPHGQWQSINESLEHPAGRGWQPDG